MCPAKRVTGECRAVQLLARKSLHAQLHAKSDLLAIARNYRAVHGIFRAPHDSCHTSQANRANFAQPEPFSRLHLCDVIPKPNPLAASSPNPARRRRAPGLELILFYVFVVLCRIFLFALRSPENFIWGKGGSSTRHGNPSKYVHTYPIQTPFGAGHSRLPGIEISRSSGPVTHFSRPLCVRGEL
jgi:hypothetical protein